MAMLDPYRRPAARPDAVVEEQRDDHILAAMLVALGSGRVVLAVTAGERFGVEPTIAAIMACLGVALALGAAARAGSPR